MAHLLPNRRSILRIVLLFAAAVLFLLPTSAHQALAHNSYQEGSPRQGEVLTTSPTTWTAVFAKSVPLESVSGEIIDGSGVRTQLTAPRHGDSDSVVIFDLPPALMGTITARWRLVGTDGHVVSGRLSFLIQSTTTLPPTTIPVSTAPSTNSEAVTIPSTTIGISPSTVEVTGDEEITSAPEPIRVALRFTNYFALIVVGGLLFTEWFIAKGSATTVMGRRLLLSGLIGSTIVPIITFLIFVNDLRLPGESYSGAVSTALSLTPGLMLIFRTVSGVAAGVIVGLSEQKRGFDNAVISYTSAVMVMYAIALAFGGHSRSQSAPWIGIPADVLHTAGVSVWLGGLVAMLMVVIPAVQIEQAITAFRRFGRAAERAVAVIIITGLIQTVRLHGDVVSFFQSSHGLLLILKISAVTLMLRLAVRNRVLLNTKRLQSDNRIAQTKAALVRASLIEIAFGGAVIGVTSVLVSVTPG